MKSILLAVAAVALVAGCASTPYVPPAPKQVIKEHNVAVQLDSSYYAIPARPVPNMSRSQMKAMKPRELISAQADFISDLRSHIVVLEKQILSIQEGSSALAKKIEEGDPK